MASRIFRTRSYSLNTSQRKCVELTELLGRSVKWVEWIPDENSAVIHLEDGYTLYVDEPTAYGPA